MRPRDEMTPDQLISFLALLVEEVCQSAVKMRVADKHISTAEWLELDARWGAVLRANLLESYWRENHGNAEATSIDSAQR